MANYIKWMFVFILIATGIASNYILTESMPFYARLAIIIISFAIAATVFVQTIQGAQVWDFMLASRNEARKVVWPSRHETVQASVVVLAMVIIMSIILWAFDSSLFMIMSWFTGQGQ